MAQGRARGPHGSLLAVSGPSARCGTSSRPLGSCPPAGTAGVTRGRARTEETPGIDAAESGRGQMQDGLGHPGHTELTAPSEGLRAGTPGGSGITPWACGGAGVRLRVPGVGGLARLGWAGPKPRWAPFLRLLGPSPKRGPRSLESDTACAVGQVRRCREGTLLSPRAPEGPEEEGRGREGGQREALRSGWRLSEAEVRVHLDRGEDRVEVEAASGLGWGVAGSAGGRTPWSLLARSPGCQLAQLSVCLRTFTSSGGLAPRPPQCLLEGDFLFLGGWGTEGSIGDVQAGGSPGRSCRE